MSGDDVTCPWCTNTSSQQLSSTNLREEGLTAECERSIAKNSARKVRVRLTGFQWKPKSPCPAGQQRFIHLPTHQQLILPFSVHSSPCSLCCKALQRAQLVPAYTPFVGKAPSARSARCRKANCQCLRRFRRTNHFYIYSARDRMNLVWCLRPCVYVPPHKRRHPCAPMHHVHTCIIQRGNHCLKGVIQPATIAAALHAGGTLMLRDVWLTGVHSSDTVSRNIPRRRLP